MRGPYDPELYDLITPASLRGDVEWYRRKAQESGGPVLELVGLAADSRGPRRAFFARWGGVTRQ